jgi:rubrerythrin
MNPHLPAGAPATSREAFAIINAVTAPTVDQLKMMVLLEASGLGAYGDLAAGAGHEGVAALLNANGREELAHAHRVKKAIEALTGEVYEIPGLDENPYYAKAEGVRVTRAMLDGIAAAEFGGETLYETWADNVGNAEAARLFRLNGREEAQHAARCQQAAALLAE